MSIILDGSLPVDAFKQVVDIFNNNNNNNNDNNDNDNNNNIDDENINQLCLSGTWQFAKEKKTDMQFKYTWTSSHVNVDLINYVSFLDRSKLRSYKRRKDKKGGINKLTNQNDIATSNNDSSNDNLQNNIINDQGNDITMIDNNEDHDVSRNDDNDNDNNDNDNNDDNDNDNDDDDDTRNDNDNDNNCENNDDDEDVDDEDEDEDDDNDDNDDNEQNHEEIDGEGDFNNDNDEHNNVDDRDNSIDEMSVINNNADPLNDNDKQTNRDNNTNLLTQFNNNQTVKINRVHPLLGLWKGTFVVKSPLTGIEESIAEEFFFHKLLNTDTQSELLNLPDDPYFSYTALRHTDISSYLHNSDKEKSKLKIEKGDPEDNKTDNEAKTARQPILIGFGRNVYGRFAVTALLDIDTGKFMCEKRYLLSKSASYRRHRSSDDIETPRQSGQRIRQAPNYNRLVSNDVGQKRKRNSFPPSLKNNKLDKGIKYSLIQAQQLQLLQNSGPYLKTKEDLGQEDDEYKIAFVDEDTGEVYEGGWIKGKNGGRRHGRGICIFTDNTMYEGMWSNGKCHGRGQLMTFSRHIIYTGEWIDGVMHGQGTYNHNNGDRYVGDWKDGNRHGKGEYIFKNGCKYSGEWKEGYRHGRGLFVWNDGSCYEGAWENDIRTGQGILRLNCGFVYDGYWLNGIMEGRGNCTFPSGCEYHGTYKTGLREGRGSITFAEGAVYEGRFKDDRIDGHGTITLTKSVPGNYDGEVMIPIQIQADMRRIHLKAGFGEEAGYGAHGH